MSSHRLREVHVLGVERAHHSSISQWRSRCKLIHLVLQIEYRVLKRVDLAMDLGLQTPMSLSVARLSRGCAGWWSSGREARASASSNSPILGLVLGAKKVVGDRRQCSGVEAEHESERSKVPVAPLPPINSTSARTNGTSRTPPEVMNRDQPVVRG